jgi:hypothetical protein
MESNFAKEVKKDIQILATSLLCLLQRTVLHRIEGIESGAKFIYLNHFIRPNKDRRPLKERELYNGETFCNKDSLPEKPSYSSS